MYIVDIEISLHETLLHLCPELQHVSVPTSIPLEYLTEDDDSIDNKKNIKEIKVYNSTLQHKAMRVVYSVGVDALVMDAYSSAGMIYNT